MQISIIYFLLEALNIFTSGGLELIDRGNIALVLGKNDALWHRSFALFGALLYLEDLCVLLCSRQGLGGQSIVVLSCALAGLIGLSCLITNNYRRLKSTIVLVLLCDRTILLTLELIVG